MKHFGCPKDFVPSLLQEAPGIANTSQLAEFAPQVDSNRAANPISRPLN